MSETFETLLEKGRPYLVDYLESKGIQASQGKFRCFHPDHDDTDPSCFIVPKSNGERFHCFGCQSAGDIFNAAHLIEDKPIHGPGFLQDNVEYILSEFNVEHDKIELSEEQILRLRYDRVYEAAAAVMTNKDKDGQLVHLDLKYAIEERGWTEATCLSMQVGSVKDFNKFLAAIQQQVSLTKEQIKEMGIDPKLFGPKRLTFTVRNHNGQVVGFACRYIPWKPGSTVPKYENTSSFRNRFYSKGQILYGLCDARKFTGLRLDVFEGYGSTVTARQAGYKNCVSIGGTAFEQAHVDLLYDLGFRHINLVLDLDEVGQPLAEKYMDRFSGYQGLKVTLTKLDIKDEDILKSEGNNDPDFFIRTYGIEAYRKLRTIGLFEHRISKSQFTPMSIEAVDFAKDMARFIVNEPSPINRSVMVRALSTHTGVPKEDIHREIDNMENSEIVKIRDDLTRKLKNIRDPDSLDSALSQASTRLENTASSKEDKWLSSITESVQTWDEIFLEMDTQRQGIHGWKTGYDPLDDMMDGIAIPSQSGVAYGIAGAPQHGKSAALLNIALRVATLNDNVTVLYWAIDDSRKAIAYRLVSMISGVSIRKVRRIQALNESESKKIKEAQATLRRLTEEGRLIFKDDRFGRSKRKAEAWIHATQDSYDRHILFCVDSLHNIAGDSELRVKLVTSSTWLKSLCTKVPLSAIATLELIKNRGDKKPNLQTISESGKMEFDFDAMAISWNEAQGAYGDASQAVARWGEEGNWKPIIELDWQKNKSAAGEKGPMYFKFDPATTRMVECLRKLEGVEFARPMQLDLDGHTVKISGESDGRRLVPSPGSPMLNLRRT